MIIVFDTEEYNFQIQKAKDLQEEVYSGKKVKNKKK